MLQLEFADFLRQVSTIFWIIISLSTFMWLLICVSYLTQRRDKIALAQHFQTVWQQLLHQNLANEASHTCLSNLFSQHMQANLNTINTITTVLPLLGLLGTVTGMSQAFQVMAEISTNQHFFSAGIANALLTTLAGLVTAISGVFFHHNLQHRATQFSLSFSQSLIRIN